MQKKERFSSLIDFFADNFPNPETELQYIDPYELLVAVILSAQCTDKRVNMVTPALFKKFPTIISLSKAGFDDVFPLIKSISYPNNKTRYLIASAKMLVGNFNSKVPETVDELRTLPGVGRKTAHVIASVLYNMPVLAIDTHVFRVARRIGLASLKSTTPLAVEKELIRHIPEHYISRAHHWLLLHGRYVCLARKPKCFSCGISNFCKYFEREHKKIA